MSTRSLAAVVLALAASAVGLGAQQTPTFQSNVEVTPIDVGVVDQNGRPITDLGPGDFTARIDGDARKVVSAQWVPLVYDPSAAKPEPLPEGFTSNEHKTPGRLIVLVVDDANIRYGGIAPVLRAATAFIDSLAPPDRVSVVGFGTGAPATPFLTDFQQAKQAVAKITGQRAVERPQMYTIALTEARAIFRGEQSTLAQVVSRECSQFPGRTQAFLDCSTEVEDEADQIALAADERGLAAIRGLGSVFAGLRAIDAPKTVVFLTEGFIIDDFQASATDIGAMAGAARASLYVLQLDDDTDVMTRRSQGSPADRQMRAAELEALAYAARGDVFRVTGTGEQAFTRVKTELTGYYLIGVQADGRDRDGKAHPVRIEVSRAGAVVRSRQQLLNASASRPGSQQQAAASGLVSPLPLAALPVRVATFALQGPERDKLQMLIHADIGNDYSGPRLVSIAYAIFNKDGQSLESHLFDARLQPEVNGVPAPLLFTTGASLPAGEYTLKFVASEGDRAGSVEHPMHAGLLDAGGVNLSELMVGGPSSVREILQPTVGYTVNFGVVHGYLEAYGRQAETVTVKYEIANDLGGAALISTDVPGRLAGDERMIFTLAMPVPQLPPGRYTLRAVVSAAAKPIKTLARTFAIVPPAVLMTPADSGAPVPAAADLFLPVDDQVLARPLVREDALKVDVLAPFRDRVPASTKAAFEAGIAALSSRDYGKAQTSLKAAVQPDVDSTSALAYLGVLYAITNNEAPAASAWQTALVDGSEMPQIYDWLAHSFVRSHNLPDARAALEEAIAKWPGDPRFTGLLAQVYAMVGRGVEAVRLLERYLDTKKDDADSLRMGVEWMYQVHSAGSVARTPVDDLKLAHEWADRYGNGPQQALVRQWIDFLDRERK